MKSVFLTYVKEQMWTKRYAKRTIETYIYWIKGFIIFTKKKITDIYGRSRTVKAILV